MMNPNVPVPPTLRAHAGRGWPGPLECALFVDGARLGTVQGSRPLSVPVRSGTRRVELRGFGMRSHALNVRLENAERVELRCGVNWQRPAGLLVLNLILAAVLFVALPGAPAAFPIWAFAGGIVTPLLIVEALWATAPGWLLRLEYAPDRVGMVGADRVARLSDARRVRLWHGLIGVAMFAGLLGLGRVEWNVRMRRLYEPRAAAYRARVVENRKLAMMSERVADRWLRLEASYADEEHELLEFWKEKSLDADTDDVQTFERMLQRARDNRARVVANAAREAGVRAHFLQAAEAYRRAAERPWEPVNISPPPVSVSTKRVRRADNVSQAP